MINANEARKIAEANDTSEKLSEVVERIMPTLDKEIRRVCEMGGTGVLVRDSIITKASGFTFWSKKKVMDAVGEELECYGYRVFIPESHTSIRILWGKV